MMTSGEAAVTLAVLSIPFILGGLMSKYESYEGAAWKWSLPLGGVLLAPFIIRLWTAVLLG